MKKMGSLTRNDKSPKLPRKRKKRAIKSQGLKWYYDTIKLYKTAIKNPDYRSYEPICKFWVNSKIEMTPRLLKNGRVIVRPTPTQYW